MSFKIDRKSWPRIGISALDTDCQFLTVHQRVEDGQAALDIAGQAGFSFRPPLTATLVPYGKEEEDGAARVQF